MRRSYAERIAQNTPIQGTAADILKLAMVELEGDRGRIEPDVQGVQHGARHRNREMHLVHRGNVRQHRRHRIAVTDAAAGEPWTFGIGLRGP